jgi:hypothetical protein
MLDKLKVKYKALFETTCGCGCKKLNKRGQMVVLAIIILLIAFV